MVKKAFNYPTCSFIVLTPVSVRFREKSQTLGLPLVVRRYCFVSLVSFLNLNLDLFFTEHSKEILLVSNASWSSFLCRIYVYNAAIHTSPPRRGSDRTLVFSQWHIHESMRSSAFASIRYVTLHFEPDFHDFLAVLVVSCMALFQTLLPRI